MKLGEALVLRADLQTRIAQLRPRLKASAIVSEGDEPPEDPRALLGELDELASELERLVRAINRTNLSATLADGRTLTDALARRDVLALRHLVVREAAEAASIRVNRYARTELRILPALDVRALREQAARLARDRRLLDAAIQEANWLTELVE